MKSISIAILAIGIAITPSAPAEDIAPRHDLLKQLDEFGGFARFSKLLEHSGLLDAVSAEKPYTVFAIPDEALGKLLAREFDTLVADSAALRVVMGGFVAEGSLSTEAIGQWNEEDFPLRNVDGEPLFELNVADVQDEESTLPWRASGEPQEVGLFTIFTTTPANPNKIDWRPIVVPAVKSATS